MPKHARLLVLTLAITMAAGVMLAPPASAQYSNTSPGGTGGLTPGRNAQRPEPPRPAAPAALPGLQRNTVVAPLAKPPSEMAPTEALFDAVNRNDLGAARDATTRGADLNARNMLGLTALELAVDLGQTDIAFYLLSLWDAGPATRTTHGPGAQTTAGNKPAPTAQRTRPTPTRTVSAPQQRSVVTDSGTPVPNAGFLGFGGR